MNLPQEIHFLAIFYVPNYILIITFKILLILLRLNILEGLFHIISSEKVFYDWRY